MNFLSHFITWLWSFKGEKSVANHSHRSHRDLSWTTTKIAADRCYTQASTHPSSRLPRLLSLRKESAQTLQQQRQGKPELLSEKAQSFYGSLDVSKQLVSALTGAETGSATEIGGHMYSDSNFLWEHEKQRRLVSKVILVTWWVPVSIRSLIALNTWSFLGKNKPRHFVFAAPVSGHRTDGGPSFRALPQAACKMVWLSK